LNYYEQVGLNKKSPLFQLAGIGRRNFLKSNNTEFRNIYETFIKLAISNPDVSFKFVNDDKTLFDIKHSSIEERLQNIYTNKITDSLITVNHESSILKINGFITKPSFAKKKKGEQFFFVNNRFIKSPYLHHAVMSAYDGLLNQGYHPSYFLYLEVPPNSIDINIHPTKTEVKFDNERDLYAIIRSTIKHSLGQYNVAPSPRKQERLRSQ